MYLKIDKTKISYYLRIISAFAIGSVIIELFVPHFFSINNILNIFRQTSVNALIAAGMTFVILSGGIDLSVGSIFALSATLGALVMKQGLGVEMAVITTVITGSILGMINGLLIGYLKLQAFIATLITMTFARGLTYIISNGIPVTMNPTLKGFNDYSYIGGGYLLGIPIPVILTIILYVFFYWLLTKTKFGRYNYAIGDNEKSALLAGLQTNKIKVIIYTLCGLTASIAGLVLTSRLASAPPTAGSGYELDAIAAVVLGGASLNGGKGSILKTLLGALIISVLANLLNLLNISSYYQMIIKSLVILLAVVGHRK